QATFDDYCAAVKRPKPGVVPLLLVDAEAAVAPTDTVWQHLKRRDNWDQPPDAQANTEFLMIQMMEHWFLADPDALEKYFGQGFRRQAIRRWPNIEAVSKDDAMNALKQATQACRKQYAKGNSSFEILALLNPLAVKTACPAAAALLGRLGA
ncbi:MAG TPA: DUF4276 family protein, partial [Kofleriaceae bacterium]|nr:DUF4276 family protein [Kofleriaceae bacterium]